MSGTLVVESRSPSQAAKFSVLTGLVCFFWAFIAWLTTVSGADILAEGVQVQSLLNAPRLVLSYPGQNHGGVLEYPLLMAFEAVAPGNPYAYTLGRLLFAFLTGFLAARLFLALFPNARWWAFLGAVILGPAALNGRTGPPGNEVGVVWLNSTYPVSWLLVIAGALLVTLAIKNSSTTRIWKAGLGGLLIGLGIYEQPTILILAVALAALILVTCPSTIRVWSVAALGVVIGVIPLALSIGPLKSPTVYSPAHFPTPTVTTALRSLGLNGQPNSYNAILPNSLGIEAGYPIFGSTFSLVAMAAFVLLTIAGTGYLLLGRRSPNRLLLGGLALAWLAAIGTIVALDSIVETIWFYGIGLAVLAWITIGALPAIRPRKMGIATACIALLITGGAFVKHEIGHWAGLPTEVSMKFQSQAESRALAESIHAQGNNYLFGSYLDVIPLGYYSGGSLRVISNHYDRFPLSETERAQGNLVVAVNELPQDDWGDEALATVRASCQALPSVATEFGQRYGSYKCPVEVIGQAR